MLNPRDAKIQKMMDLLRKLPVSEKELELSEQYFREEAGEEILEKLAPRDFTMAVADKGREIGAFLGLDGTTDADRMARVLFALGKTTALWTVPVYWLRNNSGLSPAQKAAITVAGAVRTRNINSLLRDDVLSLINTSPDLVAEAAGYLDEKQKNAKLLLLALYFFMRYPDAKPQKAGANLSGIVLGEADGRLMQEYEKLLVNSLYRFVSDPTIAAEIGNALSDDERTGCVLETAKNNFSLNLSEIKFYCGMAFLNFSLSNVLKNIIRVFYACKRIDVLEAMQNIDARKDFVSGAVNFNLFFGIPAEVIIVYAAQKNIKQLLAAQLSQNRKSFIEVYKCADVLLSRNMINVVKDVDKALCEELGKDDEKKKTFETSLIDSFMESAPQQIHKEVHDYLTGESGIDTLYPLVPVLQNQNYYFYGKLAGFIADYCEAYRADELTARCNSYMLLWCPNYFYYILNGKTNSADGSLQESVEKVYREASAQNLSLYYQAKSVGEIVDSTYSSDAKEKLMKAAILVFEKYLSENREEMLRAFKDSGSTSRCFALRVLAVNAAQNKKEILSYGQDSSKAVRAELLDILYEKKDWETEIIDLLSSKKAADRETAVYCLSKWDTKKYETMLKEAFEKEKNAKVRDLLGTVLGDSVDAKESQTASAVTLADIVAQLHKGGRKRAVAWAYETPFSKVFDKDGKEVPEEYMQAILLAYQSMGNCGVSPTAASLAAELNTSQLEVYVNELFDKWMEQGAEAKKKWVLYAASIHGGDHIVKKLHHNIQEWPQNSRGAMAAEAVQALALNPLPQALLIVDGIARKFKFKQVRAAAAKALDFAAAQLGITAEELADRIVPNLGFDENMERVFDYGERKFTVAINLALEIEVYDEAGKKLKSLPAPGKKDDEAKAAAAYEEFKQMKKQMKTTVSSQKQRLEMALSTAREWSVENWRKLFVKNPIMHQFAIGLIWGTYEDKKLIQSFRYMEDGSFNTEDEEEFRLPENGKIGLVHPIELSSESLENWKQQLEDYEISQPFEQLGRQIFYCTEEEKESKRLDRFGGCILNDLSLSGKLTALGWYRGSVQDGGGFYTYYREDREIGIGVELHFSGSYVGGSNENVTVYEVRFYPAESIKRGSYVYDEADDKNSFALKEIPARYFSETVLQLTRATASSEERNERWREAERY